MQGSPSSPFVDYFKLFKVFELKKIEKTGLVKIVQDKELNRKVVSVEGNISTSNFIAFQTHNFPNVPFSERYLYLQGFFDAGKSFCFQVAYTLGTKPFKAVYSTLYKVPKKHQDNTVHLPISMPAGRWTIAVVDLYELGLHFGFKAQEMKMMFKVNSIEVRASSKVKGVFQSDHLFSIDRMPKDMLFPLKKEENYFEKYHYFVESTDPACLKYATQVKIVIQQAMEEQQALEQQRKQAYKMKESKSNDNKKPLSASKSRKSLEKQKPNQKNSQKIINKQAKSQHAFKKSQNGPPLPPVSARRRQQKSQPKVVKEEQMQQNEIEQQQTPPVPQGMVTLALSCVEGFSLNSGSLMAVQSFLSRPVYMPVHKPIQLLVACDAHNARVVTGYVDGSICIWDAVRKAPLGYYLTELSELKVILVDSQLALVLVGLDRMKREVINIISEGSVVFRQISNYSINGALLVSGASFEHGIVTYGFENIRLWRINNEKSIIQGSNVYLGQSSRKVKYTSGVVVNTREDTLVYVSDGNGFITTVSVAEGKMLQSLKVDTCGIDQMLLLSDGRCLYSNEAGTIRVIQLGRMEVQEEYGLNSRIKHMQQLPSDQVVLTHFNKSVGSLSLQTSMYSFLMRCHTAPVTGIAYSPLLSKVVSISKDNTIRIWHHVIDHAGPFQSRLQEQYEFVITGEEMVQIVCGSEGKAEDLSKVVVGGDSGKLRAINIQKYAIEQEVMVEAGPMSLSASRNGKYVLCTYSSGNSYLLDSNLTILFKYLQTEGQKKRIKAWKNGFNRVNKQYYIENVEEERLQFYALKDPSTPIFCISFAQKAPSLISSIGSKVYVLSEGELTLFEKGSLMQVVNTNSSKMRVTSEKCTAFQFPLVCVGVGEKLLVRVVTAQIQQELELPEPLGSIAIHYNAEKQEGVVVCSGKNSFALYLFAYQLHNITDTIISEHAIIQKNEQFPTDSNQLQISFSNKTTVSGYLNRREETSRNYKNSRFQEGPKELKSLYAQEEALYEEVKQYLVPKSLHQPQQQQYEQQEGQSPQQEEQSNELGVLLNYGYELRQGGEEGEVGSFFWLMENNSLLLLTGGGRRIVQHFFSVPIRHRITSFPSAVTSVCLSPRSHEGFRYLAVCISGLIKLYNVGEEMSLVRSFDAISSTFLGAVVFQSAITRCNRYLLTLSYNAANFDGKLYIHLIQLATGSVVSSSYLPLPAPRNKHRGQQAKQAREYRMLVNYFKSSLEFVVFSPQGLLYFYRITSVLTLQTLQLEEMVPLCRDKLAALSCACFMGLEEENEQAVLVVGSENGSLVFVDCRTATILIACIAVLPSPVLAITYASHPDGDKLVLFTNSTPLTVFSLTQGLNSLLTAIDPSAGQATSQGKRTLTLDGEVTAGSNAEGGQQLVISKTGSLWLLDYQDGVTVRVSSVHTGSISEAEVLMGTEGSYLLTCSEDGTAKVSNLLNLEQPLEIYKPRRQARCFCTSGSFTLIAFNDQCYIYNQFTAGSIEADAELASLGSFRLDAPVVALQHIPSTDNYYILTENQVLVVYISLRHHKNSTGSALSLKTNSQFKNNSHIKSSSLLPSVEASVEISKISDVQSPATLAVNGDHAPYDQFAVVGKAGRATVWSRKCLKRSYNPIDELANVHELAYYLIDAHTASSACGLRFLSQVEYLWGLLDEGVVQIRNFKEHCVVREIKLSVERLTALTCVGEEELRFYAGDQHGYLSILSENGLLIDRTKALECPIKGISAWSVGISKRLLVYGGKYAATLSLPAQ